MKRNQKVYFLFNIITIVIGLISRINRISDYTATYFGDCLYAILFFLLFGFVFTKLKLFKTLIISLLFCYAIEFLQLYQSNLFKSLNVITVIFVGQSSRLTRTEKGSPLCSDRMSELPYDKP